MAPELRINTRILTDYRAVAHIVEGVGVLLFLFMESILVGFGLSQFISFAYALIEGAKGWTLLAGIKGECASKVKIYLIVSCITIVVKKILIIIAMFLIGSAGLAGVQILIFLVLICAYFAYEWFLFYHVCKLYNHLTNSAPKWNIGPVDDQVNLHNPV